MLRLPTNRTALSWVPWWLSAAIGRWRRKKGEYDKTTLACFYSAWRRRPSLTNLIAYLRFRRDLGLTAPTRLLKPLLASFVSFNPVTQRRVFNWILEGRGEVQLDEFPSSTLRDLAESSPPAAAEMAQRRELISSEAKALATLQNMQEVWRDEFTAYLSANRDSICVVGNAATIVNNAIGRTIDTSSVVFRFNRFSIETAQEASDGKLTTQLQEVGRRLDVWFFAPNIQTPYPPAVEAVEWVVLAGPDARYHLADWGNIISLLGAHKKVLTVPLSIWRKLVRDLKAPPSAGILCLAWVIEMLGTPEGLKAAGFQRKSVPGMRYHFALHRHKPSRRHNWEGERMLLRRWERQGLQFLD
ncbi:MAG: hypothetical protein JMN25_11120 [gamma proteobacterium endosymbiont of Lamellibrachia anaximandri]|nr:hypothetical protein [gamma proteobacterium endosymbiont of Lamellibrachia anaximandri]